nr:MAG TPA: hypothetical protein [Caudoviricetes sp.]
MRHFCYVEIKGTTLERNSLKKHKKICVANT